MKARAYEDPGAAGPASARAALAVALSVQLRLLAPFLPFVTEEVWSWWHDGSVHRAPWPDVAELPVDTHGADLGVLEATAGVLGEIRKAKTGAQVSQRSAVAKLVVIDDAEQLRLIAAAQRDLCDAGNVRELGCAPGPVR